jgi:transcriptional regulator with XRE-family HTH domain
MCCGKVYGSAENVPDGNKVTDAHDRFRTWLATRMAERGMSQAALARAIGTVPPAVNAWLRTGRISVEMAGLLADFFGEPRIAVFALLGWLREEEYQPPEIAPELARALAGLTSAQQRALVPLLDSVLVLREELAERGSAPEPEAAGNGKGGRR